MIVYRSSTPKTATPSQSKLQVVDSQIATASTAAEKDDKMEDSTSTGAAARTKEQTPPRPRYIVSSINQSINQSMIFVT